MSKIAIFQYDPLNTKLISEVVTSMGHEPVIWKNSNDGADSLEKGTLVITDWKDKNMELGAYIAQKAIAEGCPVLVYTADMHIATDRDFIQLGNRAEHLVKPQRVPQLQEAITLMLGLPAKRSVFDRSRVGEDGIRWVEENPALFDKRAGSDERLPDRSDDLLLRKIMPSKHDAK